MIKLVKYMLFILTIKRRN